MKGAKVQFASLMDLCHLKNSELEPQYQKYKGLELYSELTLLKMILVRMQCFLNKEH